MALGNLTAGDLTLVVTTTDTEVEVSWRGAASGSEQGAALTPFITEVVQEAVERKARLHFSFEGIQTFDSSTMMLLMRVARQILDEGLAFTVTYDGTRKWQRIYFRALSALENPDHLLVIRAA